MHFWLSSNGGNDGRQKTASIGDTNGCIQQLAVDFSKSPIWMVVFLVSSFRLCRIAVTLSASKLMQQVVPSKTNPRISFLVAQHPSPFFNFLMELGLSLALSCGPGLGKILWMPCKMACVKWRRASCDGAATIPMKSSM